MTVKSFFGRTDYSYKIKQFNPPARLADHALPISAHKDLKVAVACSTINQLQVRANRQFELKLKLQLNLW